MEGGEDPEFVTCPGKSYAIPVAMCRSRQSWGFAGGRRCKHRQRKAHSHRRSSASRP